MMESALKRIACIWQSDTPPRFFIPAGGFKSGYFLGGSVRYLTGMTKEPQPALMAFVTTPSDSKGIHSPVNFPESLTKNRNSITGKSFFNKNERGERKHGRTTAGEGKKQKKKKIPGTNKKPLRTFIP